MSVDSRLPADATPLPSELEHALFEALAPQPLAEPRASAVKARLLARVHAAGKPGLTTIAADEGDWRPFLPKVAIKVLHREGEILSYLLRLDAGAVLVPHSHPVAEECMVLEGEVRIGAQLARAGAYHRAPQGVDHAPIVSDRGALLFLRGAVPHASQVRWASLATLAAIAPQPLRDFIKDW